MISLVSVSWRETTMPSTFTAMRRRESIRVASELRSIVSVNVPISP
jgi:hypothetical protein